MSTIAIIGRMLVALVVVLGVMWALAKWARKPLGAGKSDKVLTVLARQQLSRSSSVAVLKLMDRALVLGVTEQGVQLLAETELGPLEDALTVEAPSRHRRSAKPISADSDPRLALDGLDRIDSIDGMDGMDGIDRMDGAPGWQRRTARPAVTAGGLDGSILSPKTWKQLLGAARELTVRR